jgi:hypothetical protein
VIEIVLLEGKHFILEFTSLVPALQILLQIEQVLDVLVEDVDGRTLLFYYLLHRVAVEVSLRRVVFRIQATLHPRRRTLRVHSPAIH